MALNRLLWYCLNQKTSLQQNNVGVSHEPAPGERALFFKTDCPEFRNYFGVPADVKLCDGLIFYRKRDAAPRFIFVELKSDDASDAEKQIKSTLSFVEPYIPKKLEPPAELLGLIVLRSGVHSSRNRRDRYGRKRLANNRGLTITQKGGVRGNVKLRDCGVL